ncbi:MAG: DUF6056 family protein [Alistipes timonensis]|nr:DUF6056 family protein [Alistipes timonensis]
MRNTDRWNLWLFGAAALFAVCAAAIWACAPVMKEDVAFREMLRHFNGGSDAFSLRGLSDYIQCQREVDNGRLANIISPLATLYGGALLRGAIAGLSLAATPLFLVLIARGSGRPSPADTLLYGCAALAGFFLLPFRDNMVVFDYALNYILSAALSFGFLLGACRALEKPRGWGETAIVCLAGLLAGANHDGFALPLLAAAGCYALFGRKLRLPGRCWAMGAALLLGALVPVTAPAEWSRAAGSLGGANLAASLAAMIKFAPALFLAPLAAIAALLSKGARGRFSTPAAPLLALLWVFSLALFLPFGLEPRQGWLPGCAAIGLLMIWAREPLRRLPSTANLAVGAALTAAACGVALYVAKWQHTVAENDAATLAALHASPTGTAYVDRLNASDLPRLSLARMANDEGNLSVSYGPLNLNAPEGKVYIAVPADIKDFSADKARRIAGNARLLEYGRHLLADTIPEAFERGYSAGGYSEAWLTIEYHFSDGFATTARHRAFRFPLPDGTPMVYIIADGLRHATAGRGDITMARLVEAEPFAHQTGGR